jgi:3-polyprenyl-4-hydroxybenzoate decarboxylase
MCYRPRGGVLAGHHSHGSLARMGVAIVPPVPAFYNHPETIGDIVD